MKTGSENSKEPLWCPGCDNFIDKDSAIAHEHKKKKEPENTPQVTSEQIHELMGDYAGWDYCPECKDNDKAKLPKNQARWKGTKAKCANCGETVYTDMNRCPWCGKAE